LINKLLESKKQTQRNRSTVKLSTNAVSIYTYTHTHTHRHTHTNTVERLVIGSQRAEEPNHSTNRKYFKCMTNA